MKVGEAPSIQEILCKNLQHGNELIMDSVTFYVKCCTIFSKRTAYICNEIQTLNSKTLKVQGEFLNKQYRS